MLKYGASVGVAVTILLLSACRLESGSDDETGVLMDFTVLAAESSTTNVRAKRLEVIETDARLQQVWNELGISEPVPAIDFSAKRVLAVIAGPRPTPCHDVSIEAVREHDNVVIVEVRYGDGGGHICAQVIAYPFVLASIENTGKPVQFIEYGD